MAERAAAPLRHRVLPSGTARSRRRYTQRMNRLLHDPLVCWSGSVGPNPLAGRLADARPSFWQGRRRHGRRGWDRPRDGRPFRARRRSVVAVDARRRRGAQGNPGCGSERGADPRTRGGPRARGRVRARGARDGRPFRSARRAGQQCGRTSLWPGHRSEHDSWTSSCGSTCWPRRTARSLPSRRWRRRAAGTVVNVSSTNAVVGRPNMAQYDATKAALLALTRDMACDHADQKVRVNAICPGSTVTTFHIRRQSRLRGITPEEAEAALWREG